MVVHCIQRSMAQARVIPPENSSFRPSQRQTFAAHQHVKKKSICISILCEHAPFLKISAHFNVSHSPFTESHSVPKWLHRYPIAGSSCSLPSEEEPPEEHDIALQLPELHEILKLLRSRGEGEACAGKGRGPGNVYLVGTGPGDPELLTLKALRLMQTADLVLYDRLVSTDIMDMVHSGARLLYVGKTAGYHSRTQDEIHQLLLSFAEAGATVVRLKGGDPLVFGRGGEEMDFLQQQGIQVKVVPGITAASGIAATLGIPLTHRGVANNVRFLTGHSRKGGTDPLFVTKHVADPDSTLVIYMGLATIQAIAHKLISDGLSPITPAAAVERGTTAQQRLVFAELQNLAEDIINAQLVSPTLIIIGNVVALSPYWAANSTKEQAEQNKNKSVFSEAV